MLFSWCKPLLKTVALLVWVVADNVLYAVDTESSSGLLIDWLIRLIMWAVMVLASSMMVPSSSCSACLWMYLIKTPVSPVSGVSARGMILELVKQFISPSVLTIAQQGRSISSKLRKVISLMLVNELLSQLLIPMD